MGASLGLSTKLLSKPGSPMSKDYSISAERHFGPHVTCPVSWRKELACLPALVASQEGVNLPPPVPSEGINEAFVWVGLAGALEECGIFVPD